MKARALKLFAAKGSLESLEKQLALWGSFRMDYELERRRQGREIGRRVRKPSIKRGLQGPRKRCKR